MSGKSDCVKCPTFQNYGYNIDTNEWSVPPPKKYRDKFLNHNKWK